MMVWLPVVSFAFTPGVFIVSLAEVDLGAVREIPGSSAGHYAFTVSFVGGLIADSYRVINTDSDGEAVFFASCDATWLTLDPAGGTSPGSITATATVSETMGSDLSDLWAANVTILSGLDPNTQPVTIPVTINVIRSIGHLMTVYPAKLDLRMTDQNTSQQIFFVTIANTAPNKPTGLLWSARTDISWLALSYDEEARNSTTSLRVDPEANYLNTDNDKDVIMDSDKSLQRGLLCL